MKNNIKIIIVSKVSKNIKLSFNNISYYDFYSR